MIPVCDKLKDAIGPCECHPGAYERMVELVQKAAVDSIKKLARELLDDELILNEEILVVNHY